MIATSRSAKIVRSARKSTCFSSQYNISNRIAVVTGGGSVLGLSSALALSSAGAHIIILGCNPEKLSATLKILHQPNPSAKSYVLEVSDYHATAIRTVAAKIAGEHHVVDNPVNYAGVSQPPQPCAQVSYDTFDHMLRTNLHRAYWRTQAFLL